MNTIKNAKENEPIFFILPDANTYFRVEMNDDRLIVTCDNFAWGPQRISTQAAGRNELELSPVVTRHAGASPFPGGFIVREIGPRDVAAGESTGKSAHSLERPFVDEIRRLRKALIRIANLSIDSADAQKGVSTAIQIAREALEG